MIRLILIGLFLFFFLVLLCPALLVEWIIGKLILENNTNILEIL